MTPTTNFFNLTLAIGIISIFFLSTMISIKNMTCFTTISTSLKWI